MALQTSSGLKQEYSRSFMMVFLSFRANYLYLSSETNEDARGVTAGTCRSNHMMGQEEDGKIRLLPGLLLPLS